MLNYIWLFLLLGSLVVGGVNGRLPEVTQAMFAGAGRGVEVAIGLVGVMAFWLGILKIAEAAGLVGALVRLLQPVVRPLFPGIPRKHPALGAILLNLSANFLGLGNAATPLGIDAMKKLSTLNRSDPTSATPAMCTFLVLNTAGLTLVPAVVMAIRAAEGSRNPGEIIGPTIVATSTALAVGLMADATFRAVWARRRRGPGSGGRRAK